MLFSSYRQLKKMGIMGMNRRNADFVQKYNPRHLYPLVDDKLQTKELAIKHDVAVPPLYDAIKREYEIARLEKRLEHLNDFVIKPAHGSGGDGILVITGRRKSGFIKASGEWIGDEDVKLHCSNILSGRFSLGGIPDTAMIEYRVEFDPIFKDISFQGVPDIRMIVFQGFPVMGMLRLPTRMSQGKANLHQGAIGVGLDIATGQTGSGTWLNDIIDYHPDTGQDISGLTIPNWETILEISAGCYEMTGLGYMGVDLVLDKHKGPLMLELNARPGLSIQIANQTGLTPRLDNILNNKDLPRDLPGRTRYAKENF